MDDDTQENPQAQSQLTNPSLASDAAPAAADAQENGASPVTSPSQAKEPAAPAADLNKLDLSQLQGFSFGTKWENKPEEKREGRRGDNHAGGPGRRGFSDTGRDRRGFSDKRESRSGEGRGDAAAAQRDRRAFRKPQGGTAATGDFPSPRHDSQNGERSTQPRRNTLGGAERRQGGGESTSQGTRRGGSAGAGRFYQQNRETPQPPYDSPHFAVSFYPEDTSFAALAKTIRSSYRTLELFEIARTVVAKNDRFIALLNRKPSANPTTTNEAAPRQAIYIARPDGVPFDNEEAVINHVISQHIGQFFETEQVQVDPPKGNFQVINRCGVTGELLGPPNYHRYNQIVQQHFDARIKHLSFEAFRAKIETLRDEAAVAEWLEKMKTVTRYTWRGSAKRPKADASGEAVQSQTEPLPQETDSAAATAVSESEKPSDVEAVVPASEAPSTENEEPKAEAAAAAAESSEAPAADAAEPTSAAQEQSVEDSSPPKDGEGTTVTTASFDSLEEAKVYLLTHARDKVYRTSDTARFHGNLLDKLPEGEIRRAIEGALERQRRFPLDTANGLRGRLRREHFTIFKKGSKGISYVCAVKRKFRTPGQTFADSISALIEFIEKHPMVLVSELPERFLGLKAEVPLPKASAKSTDNSAQPVADAPAPSAQAASASAAGEPAHSAAEGTPPSAPASSAQAEANAESESPETVTAATPVAVPAAVSGESAKDAVAEREALHRLQLDLRWLVTEGYVTEFMDGRLFAAPPVPESRKHAAENADTPDLENFPDAPKPKEAAAAPSPLAQAKCEEPPPSPTELSPAAAPESSAADGREPDVARDPSTRSEPKEGLGESNSAVEAREVSPPVEELSEPKQSSQLTGDA